MRAFILTALLVSIASTGNANETKTIYRCDYTIEELGKPSFTMSGNIIKSHFESEYDAIYLTLQPTTSSGINLDARILITGEDYNPMTLHPRGDTVHALARTELKGERSEISYKDANGVSYSLKCFIEALSK
jgi:hypothetical protein